ncbi:MAG TPA: hypothetical protein VEB64_18745, partial [Azospirillaceae bacterium]|nr:hypothetical protein [Azospirillaceae bacterium]
MQFAFDVSSLATGLATGLTLGGGLVLLFLKEAAVEGLAERADLAARLDLVGRHADELKAKVEERDEQLDEM